MSRSAIFLKASKFDGSTGCAGQSLLFPTAPTADKANTHLPDLRSLPPGSGRGVVRADTAYRSKVNEEWLAARGLTSRIHRKMPKGRPMPEHIRRGNATRSWVRSAVEHVFAQQKARMGLFIRTIGIERARAKVGLVNIAYNMARLVFHQQRRATT